TFVLLDDAALCSKRTIALMRFEKFRVPKIENQPAALSNCVGEPSKNVAIHYRIEMSEALAHHDRGVASVALGLIIPNVSDYVVWPAAEFTCSCDRISVTINSGY